MSGHKTLAIVIETRVRDAHEAQHRSKTRHYPPFTAANDHYTHTPTPAHHTTTRVAPTSLPQWKYIPHTPHPAPPRPARRQASRVAPTTTTARFLLMSCAVSHHQPSTFDRPTMTHARCRGPQWPYTSLTNIQSKRAIPCRTAPCRDPILGSPKSISDTCSHGRWDLP